MCDTDCDFETFSRALLVGCLGYFVSILLGLQNLLSKTVYTGFNIDISGYKTHVMLLLILLVFSLVAELVSSFADRSK